MMGDIYSLNKLTHMRDYRGCHGFDRHWTDSFPKVLAQPQCELPVPPSVTVKHLSEERLFLMRDRLLEAKYHVEPDKATGVETFLSPESRCGMKYLLVLDLLDMVFMVHCGNNMV